MIKFRAVSKTYDNGTRAIKNLSMTIRSGEFVFIAGRSGSGKSTIVKLLTGEIQPTTGLIEVNGTMLNDIRKRELPAYRRHLGIVFQDFRLLNDRNIYENVAFAKRITGASPWEIKEDTIEMLRVVGLSSKYKAMPQQLSGGEQQRAAIARALVNRPDIILADEPTGNLDEANSAEILKLLLRINESGTTVVLITHSRDLIEAAGKRVIYMEKGVIKDDIPAEDS